MTPAVIALCAALLVALWWLIAAQRRRLRRHLLERGERAAAFTVFVQRHERRPGTLLASYTDGRGRSRTVAKIPPRCRDRAASSRPATVLFDPRRPGRDDHVLLGFGEQPTRWHRVVFDERKADRARTHV